MLEVEALCVLDSDHSLKEGQLSTAEEVLWRQRKKIYPLVANQVLDLCDQRRQLKYYVFLTNDLPYRPSLKKIEKSRRNPRA